MRRVLIIEDNATTLQSCAQLLRLEGYHVGTAASGRAGLEELHARPYDLVLADLFLGDMTAIDVLDRMREAAIDVLVVVMTGHGAIESAVDAMRHGAVDYALKPLIGEEFLERVELGLHGANPHASRVRADPDAATRWAGAVVGLLRARADVRTTGQWARAMHVSGSTLRVWCRHAGMSARESLLIARLLRAVFHSQSTAWRAATHLRVTDGRTLERMLRAGGLPPEAPRVTVSELLARQSIVRDPDLVTALRAALTRAHRPP